MHITNVGFAHQNVRRHIREGVNAKNHRNSITNCVLFFKRDWEGLNVFRPDGSTETLSAYWDAGGGKARKKNWKKFIRR